MKFTLQPVIELPTYKKSKVPMNCVAYADPRLFLNRTVSSFGIRIRTSIPALGSNPSALNPSLIEREHGYLYRI